MRYAALAPGKRFRPFLVLESASLFGVDEKAALAPACALELIHAYSLVHDDLPCMDDDDLRRGRPTAHRKFDEATAVLAGDALQSLAFEIITDEARTPFDGETRAALALTLARAAGQAGMAGGQMSDLQGSEDFLEVASMKTGALILAALSMGVIMGRAAQGRAEAVAIHQYGVDLGQLFQLADDLLDAEGDAGEVGKATGKDAEAGKANIVTRLGVVEARRQCEELVRSATARLEIFGEQASSLRDAAQFVLHRRR